MKVFEALPTSIVLIEYNDVKHPKGPLLLGFNLLGPDQDPGSDFSWYFIWIVRLLHRKPGHGALYEPV